MSWRRFINDAYAGAATLPALALIAALPPTMKSDGEEFLGVTTEGSRGGANVAHGRIAQSRSESLAD